MITFDVRLSNTAAKSSQWLHVNPGTDGAVALALCHVILSENLLSKEAEELLNFCQVSDDHAIPLSEKILILKAHLKQYSPRWAERVSGVSASLIKTIAREIVANSPAAIISGGGIRKHSNGFETERAILLLLSGNLQRSGSRTRAVLPNWQFASLANPDETAIASNDAYINDQVLHQIANEEISTPEIKNLIPAN